MKKQKKFLSLFLASLTLLSILSNSILVSAKSFEDPYSKYMVDSYIETTNDYIYGLADRLIKFTPSKDVCVDFLYQEILLHRALLFTTSNIESFTKNPELLDITDDISDYYSGELKEMREALTNLITLLKTTDFKNDDTAYMKDYKAVIDKMVSELSTTNAKESDEATYLKQSLAILDAIYSLAENSLKYSKNTLTKEIAESIIKNTDTYINSLQALQKTIK